MRPRPVAFGLVAFGFLGMGPSHRRRLYGPVTDNAHRCSAVVIERIPNQQS